MFILWVKIVFLFDSVPQALSPSSHIKTSISQGAALFWMTASESNSLYRFLVLTGYYVTSPLLSVPI